MSIVFKIIYHTANSVILRQIERCGQGSLCRNVCGECLVDLEELILLQFSIARSVGDTDELLDVIIAELVVHLHVFEGFLDVSSRLLDVQVAVAAFVVLLEHVLDDNPELFVVDAHDNLKNMEMPFDFKTQTSIQALSIYDIPVTPQSRACVEKRIKDCQVISLKVQNRLRKLEKRQQSSANSNSELSVTLILLEVLTRRISPKFHSPSNFVVCECTVGVIILMRPNEHHTLNTSVYRQSCRFGKAPRFKQSINTQTDFKYHLSPKRHNRATSFGIGNRPHLQQPSNAPTPNRYNVHHFPHDSRAAPLLSGKEEVVFQSMINAAEKKGILPSPGAYNLPEEHGLSYSLGMRLPGQIEATVSKRVPGPGQYKTLQMNKSGRYAVSKVRNTRCISFGQPKKSYYRGQHHPSPADYSVNDSSFSEQKIKMMRRNTAKTFTSGRRTPVIDTTKNAVPGPGQYQSFSSFGGSQFVPSIN